MTLAAALYAAVHNGTPGDRAFYSDVCRGARSVLELGCGGGRLLSTLAAGGRRVVGVDHDAGALSLVDADVVLALADMRTVDLGERFDRVVLAFNGLWCLPGRDAMAAALANAARHLEVGGRLALDVYRADEFHAESSPGDWAEDESAPIATVRVDGRDWTVRERSRWDRDEQVIEVTYDHEADDGERVQSVLVHHYLMEDDLLRLVQAAGLTPVDLRHGLVDYDSLLLVAERGPA